MGTRKKQKKNLKIRKILDFFAQNRWFWTQLQKFIADVAPVGILTKLVYKLLKGWSFIWQKKILAHSARWPEIGCQSQPIFKQFFIKTVI